MAHQDSVVRLLLVDDQLEDAEQTISILRNGGIAIRPTRPENIEQLESALAGQTVDLVVAWRDAKSIPFDEVLQTVAASGKDVPVIALLATLDEEGMLATIAAGARNIVLRGRAPHLQAVVRHEFTTLEQRRSVRRLEASLRETERRCDALIASSRDPIAYVHEGMHIRANLAYLEMFGYESFEEIEGLPLLDMIAGADADKFKQLLKKLSKGEAPPKNLELQAQRSDGETFAAVMEFTQASYEGEPCLQIVFRPQILDAEMAKELDELRMRDQVTGLFNRQHFTGELDTAVADAAGGRNDQALLLIELDNYANLLNDIGLGHADELLSKVARRLEMTLGGNAQAARFTDHGFAVLIRDSNHVATREQAERIRAGFQGAILEAGDSSLSTTVSIGGVQIGEKIATTAQVLGKAGQCLQGAQAEGGNQIQIFDPGARDRAEEERIAQWVERIEAALDNEGFVFHYQPVISLQGEPEETYRVLLRIKGPTGELVLPEVFLPIAEEHNLMARIDRWSIKHAIDAIAARKKAGRTTTLLVNLHPDSLQDAQLATWIGINLKQGAVPGAQLVLSIPESKAFTNLKATQALQKALARVGCAMCLEQFGLGLNSFQLLSHIDAQYLRIDPSLIGDLGKNPESQKKVREIADHASSIGRKTIAEGVQDAASMTALFTSSVNFVEGAFLAPSGPDMNYDFAQ
ncbi:GGDEF/EAL domain-containing response regulator [Chiayiivirga flava]|uniref:Diguanylate cyclase (GGDEF)-like protein/PAS domain S-box-containing protein n=1 Tax=Chiayiivirga flava TaxID=659595 RepID=A0A7W8D3J5_9GAMM|nr:EAL domain-containing protein [Chiayiivirga flava]MBB5206817.1 diguanylate cyclase (GGDEF)-like protein/PAS domain S-box-containing protein [Chiayiivirga flava]